MSDSTLRPAPPPGPGLTSTVWRPEDAEDPTMPSGSGVVIPTSLAPGRVLVGRYTVLGLLGQGGMGLVLAAYDALLDRRVALKLLRHRADGSSGGEAERARLVREAQSMARLSHPNVVAVYDAGTLEDGALFIAMEYVEGQTLRRWCARKQRSWEQILATYVEAGRGLAAAHAAGLIHRDFKPDNVLVGEDGRARVTDFGLARVGPSQGRRAPAPLADSGAVSAAGDGLTASGVLLGTPRYMAPELLLDGRPADVRTDLFAFCAALYEALYGQYPFEGDNLSALMASHVSGALRPPPAASEVPAWVTRAVFSGLRRDPSQRPASMEALLSELADDPRARRRTRVLAAGVTLALVLLGGLATWGWTSRGEPACTRMDRLLEGVWDAPTRARMEQALAATGVPYAADTAQRAAALLDTYAGRWLELRTETCQLAGAGETGQPGSLTALRESCLERRRSRLRAVTELLAGGGDRALVDQAVQAVQSLPPLDYCADAEALTAAVPPPEDPALRARVDALEEQADRLEALYEAGQYATGLALGDELLQQVESVAYPPLQARVQYVLSMLREASGDYDGSTALAQRAIVAAAQGKDLQQGARAWSQLMFVLGSRRGRSEEALGLSLALEAAVELAGDPVTRADADNTLGNLYGLLERHEEARERHARALAVREVALGPEHPHTTLSLTNLGRTLHGLGRHEEALQALERALAVRTKVLGPEHPGSVFALKFLGDALMALGRDEEARASFERALALREKAIGADDPLLYGILTGLGSSLRNLGRPEEARQYLERALQVREQTLGPDNFLLTPILNSLGRVLRDLGRLDEARQQHTRALTLQERVFPPTHPSIASTLLALGELELASGRPDLALPLLERALAQGGIDDRALTQLELAEALWSTPQERPRARELAAQSREYWRALGHRSNLDRATQWLNTHPAGED